VSAYSNRINGSAPAHGGDMNIIIQLGATNGVPAAPPVLRSPIY
jgi:hypothetical protein